MYIWKGMKDNRRIMGTYYNNEYDAHYLELPLLLSFKISALRLNAGPYFSFCIMGDIDFFDDFDIGLSTGVGFDIGMFYIGLFYDYGFTGTNYYRSDYRYDGYEYRFSYRNINLYNRTLGLNVGINL